MGSRDRRSVALDRESIALCADADAGHARVLGGVNTGDQVIEADAFASAALTPNAWYGVMARYRGAGDFYYLRVGQGDRVSLGKQVNGSTFELDSAP